MISVYDVRKALEKGNPEITKVVLDETKKNVLDAKTHEFLCSIETYAQIMRKHLHCDFEVIYHEHVSLTTIYRCKECGTVIFGGDDEERYDPNLKCPTCGEYKTWLEFWTKEEIEADSKKQEELAFLDNAMKEMEAMYRRKKKRGLNDWELWKKSFRGKEKMCDFSLECNNYFAEGLKGLKFIVNIWKKDDAGSFIWKNKVLIPLSFYAFWVHWIYPYTKKCHPSVRKYYWWQKLRMTKDTIS